MVFYMLCWFAVGFAKKVRLELVAESFKWDKPLDVLAKRKTLNSWTSLTQVMDQSWTKRRVFNRAMPSATVLASGEHFVGPDASQHSHDWCWSRRSLER